MDDGGLVPQGSGCKTSPPTTYKHTQSLSAAGGLAAPRRLFVSLMRAGRDVDTSHIVSRLPRALTSRTFRTCLGLVSTASSASRSGSCLPKRPQASSVSCLPASRSCLLLASCLPLSSRPATHQIADDAPSQQPINQSPAGPPRSIQPASQPDHLGQSVSERGRQGGRRGGAGADRPAR